MSPSNRTRNWASVFYPDSAPENWLDIITELVVPCFISPLHDKDLNPDGTPKKAHYHVMIMFDSVKTSEQAKDIFKSINAVGCERVNSARGYARYLLHLDNPEKYQYSLDDVIALAGADYQSVISLASDRTAAIKEMMSFCRDNNVVSFSDLLDYAMDNNDGWFRVLTDSATIVMREYLKSRTWTFDYNNRRVEP